MLLKNGDRLGAYEILGLLGTGGMGEVYRARDTNLDREVAIKVLPARVATNAQALGRFEREAKAVAALAHPNILAIYDFGNTDGKTYAVMELLQGENLRDRLAHGALPARKATELGRQIARGLGAAHARGVVHRDLKPENIFIGTDGRAKILDFGLAVEMEGTLGAAGATVGPTRTSLTAPGTVMGTVGYMSPEQVRGEAADHRTDIFSFGVVLQEMMTGRRAFSRETAAETMTAILREEPDDVDSSPSTVNPALDRVVRRCLEKSPDERFQSAQDLAFAIDSATTISGVDTAVGISVPVRRVPRRAGWWVAGLAGLIGLAIGFAFGPSLRGAYAPALVRARTITVSGQDTVPTASPDGQVVAFMSDRDGTPRIWIKQLSGGGEQPLTDGPDHWPQFSPDGSTLLFTRDEGGGYGVYRQSLIGGQARKLVDNAVEAAWSPDGKQIAFLRLGSEEGRRIGSIGVADSQEGNERVLFKSNTGQYGVRWSPDGETIVAIEAAVTGNNPDYRLVFVDPDSGEIRRDRPPGDGYPLSTPAWTRDGDLVFAVASSLLGDQGDSLSRFVLYDPESRESETLFWAQHLFPLQGLRADFTTPSIVRPGTLVFHTITVREYLREFDLRSAGRPGSERLLTRSEGRDRQPVYSRDGRRVVFSSNRSGNLDLWSLDLTNGDLLQMTDDAAQDWDPGFSPDGQHIVWSSDRGGHLEIWVANADGSGARQLTDDGLDAENPTVTADGEWVVYWSANPEKAGVWKIRFDGSDAMLLADGFFMQPELSPDGRYAAFVFMEIDALRNFVYVVDVESGEMVPFQVEISTPSSVASVIFGRVRWLPDGSALAFLGADDRARSGVFAQDFAPGEDTSSTRRILAGFSPDYVTESFGISPDGNKIILATLEETKTLMLADDVPSID